MRRAQATPSVWALARLDEAGLGVDAGTRGVPRRDAVPLACGTRLSLTLNTIHTGTRSRA